MAKLCQDADWQLPLHCEQGVSLGAAEPLSDCVHFPCKDDPADLDADLVSWSRNYATAEQIPEIASELLCEDLACENSLGVHTLGLNFWSTWACRWIRLSLNRVVRMPSWLVA